MDPVGAVGGLLSLIIGLFGIVLAIMGILTPFFIYRIRNEVVEINKQMATVISMMPASAEHREYSGGSQSGIRSDVKRCMHCGTNNRIQDSICMACNKPV